MELLIHSQTPIAVPMKFGLDKLFHPTRYQARDYLSMIRFKLGKRAPVLFPPCYMKIFDSFDSIV